MRPRRVQSVAVVGAGMGGLTASLYLALNGHEVFLLERAKYPGGTAGYYVKRGIVYPTGATLTFGLEPGGLFRSILEDVGVDIDARPVSHVMDVVLPDRRVPIVVSRNEWLDILRNCFSERATSVLQFWSAVEKTAEAAYLFAKARANLPARTRDDFTHLLAVAARHQGLFRLCLPRLRWTVADALREFGLEDYAPFRLFLDAQLMDAVQTSSEEAAWLPSCLALDIYRYGVWLPSGGVPAMAAKMAERARDLGVHLLFSNTVTDVKRSASGKMWCVRTNRGHEICVDAVVNATGTRLTGQTDEPIGTDSTSQAPQAPWGAVRVDALVDALGLKPWLPNASSGEVPFAIQIANDEPGPHAEPNVCGPVYLTIHPEPVRAGDRAEWPGAADLRVVTVSAHTDPARWMNLERAAYRARKEQWLQQLWRLVDRHWPHFSEHVVSYTAGTPLTYARYLNKPSVGGLPLTVANAVSHPKGPRTAWPWWFLAGDTVFPGPGILSASLSGFFAARSIDPRVGTQAYKRHRYPGANKVIVHPPDGDPLPGRDAGSQLNRIP
ncbi:phytoene desaturase family protein [Alicyclobacillus vulcanalis]|uniref:Phytoene dehydrogenase-related protein n=1 Tax=Alicyclobacillus vulcanalis TaxID=252246 RepID=A0A1N7LI23_9BACL|nr:NAD(P)/FAD-dependent oxidoreductase [Alicyclobacillus vulcanalis]SIS73449.1 Phytoene dehydrogenase-related protein [Alicyclobacillus vulcanalis]